MKKRAELLILAFALLPWVVWAQTAGAPAPKKIFPPLFLKSSDKVPLAGLSNPAVPDEGPDRSPLKVDEAIDAPATQILEELSDPDLFEILKGEKKEEPRIGQVNWHVGADFDLDYCHFRDEEGNHWYGWSDGQAFDWVLMLGNRYWWRDAFAGHWLYYARNHWWRADLQTPNSLQVLIQGEYYLCQKDGTILKDMGQDGNGEILSGNGPFRGDFHHGGHSHGEGHGSNNGPNGGANAGSSQGSPGPQ